MSRDHHVDLRSSVLGSSKDYEYDIPKRPLNKSIFSVNNQSQLGNPRVKLPSSKTQNNNTIPYQGYQRPEGSTNEYIYEELGDDRDQ